MREKTEKSGSSGRRAWIIAAGVLLWLILMAALALLLDARTVRFYIYGEDEITLEYGTPYVEPGFYAVTTGRLFGESEKHLEVETSPSPSTPPSAASMSWTRRRPSSSSGISRATSPPG